MYQLVLHLHLFELVCLLMVVFFLGFRLVVTRMNEGLIRFSHLHLFHLSKTLKVLLGSVTQI